MRHPSEVRNSIPTRALLLCVLLLLAQSLSAQLREHTAKVTYVTSTTVYVDAGTKDGFREGDTLRIWKAGSSTAMLKVTHIASKSLAASILEKTQVVLIGDEVRGSARTIAQVDATRDTATTLVQAPVRGADAVRRDSLPRIPDRVSETRVRGRIALQYHALESSVSPGLDFSQPAGVVHVSTERLFNAPLEFRYYSNHRYDARSSERRAGVEESRFRHRFYQLSLQYGEAAAPLTARIGRFVPYEVGGIGTLDGAMVVGRSNGYEIGALLGSQPGYRDSELNIRDQKVALYVGRNRVPGNWNFGAAFAQTYRDGALDRGYVYLVNSVAVVENLTLYQNASVDLYDTDGRDGMFAPHFSDFFLSATWRPLRVLSLSASMSDRRNIFFLRSYAEIPDSSFRSNRSQSYQFSAGANVAAGMYLSVTSALRNSESTDPAASISGRFTWSNVLNSRLNLYFFGGYADNVFTTSTSAGVEVNRDLFQSLYTALRLVRSDYAPVTAGRAYARTSLNVDAYYRASREVNVSLNFEHYWEGTYVTDRVYTEVTYRFD
ncbi:MAG TPA: hypothetical protein PK916_16395 [Bacteroidota bacterium]|nr:hypothetical protein [Bacteroidota bacterium]